MQEGLNGSEKQANVQLKVTKTCNVLGRMAEPRSSPNEGFDSLL